MRLLYIGDIMGPLGVRVVSGVLPKLKETEHIDVVAAQAENVTEGKGISQADFQRLKDIGIDFFTGGNHSFGQPEIADTLNDPNQPIIRPANYPKGTEGLGYKYLKTSGGKLLFISLLGQIVGKDAATPV
ncbi:MAG TPA: YmdB family metallophosphoesterase, partial [Candidatus Saccharimonadales bacterium]